MVATDLTQVPGLTEIAELVERDAECEFPHNRVPRASKCSSTVVALLGATCEGSPAPIRICQDARDFIQLGFDLGHCRNCLRKCWECWWMRSI